MQRMFIPRLAVIEILHLSQLELHTCFTDAKLVADQRAIRRASQMGAGPVRVGVRNPRQG
jgi:hypothetical protein